MRIFSLFCLSFLFCTSITALDSLFTYILQEGIQEDISFNDSLSILIDQNNSYSIEEVMTSKKNHFALLDNEQTFEFPLTVWSRVHFINNTAKEQFYYLLLCHQADSVWVYSVDNGEIVGSILTGEDISATEKDLLSDFNLVPFRLDGGKKRTYYIKIHFKTAVGTSHLHELYIKPGKQQIHRVLKRFAFYSFFAGVLALFFLVSVFMYFIFRENIFIFFGLLMLSFVIYFLSMNSVIDSFFTIDSVLSKFHFEQLGISGIILFMFLFIVIYVNMSQYSSRYYQIFMWVSIGAATYAHICFFLGVSYYETIRTHNIVILIWAIITMIPLFLLVRSGEKSAKILLYSIGLLFMLTVIFILGTYHILPMVGIVRYGIQIGTVIFASILFYSLFDKINVIRTEKERFKELDHLKSRFFANISHEFRTPLTLIIGPIKQLITKQKDIEDKKLLVTAHRNANRLLQLINQLLDLSKLEAGKMTLQTREVDFPPLLKGITMSFESLAKRKHIDLHFVSQNPQIRLYLDVDKVEKIFYNLLSNAFKFTKEQGEVAVMITEEDEFVNILIRDNGIGIPNRQKAHIFNRFYQVDDSTIREQEGSGIGLALVKEFIELHHGNVAVESAENKGTTFTIRLPKGKVHLQRKEIVDMQATDNQLNKKEKASVVQRHLLTEEALTTSDSFSFPSSDQATILVIEDHEGVRNYIKQYLVGSFTVIEAVNGQDGIDRALEYLPDLIISDVMMPKKNGYEVCEILKKDQRTSHIPLILLTAKAAQEEKIKGLEIGADDYLVKPFDTKELEVRVRNLIKIREDLRKRFTETGISEPATLAANTTDKTFWESIKKTVEENLDDEQFSVEVLAEAVGMSRVHLNRKLKALTNQSANKFIQSCRLQHALLLLQKKAGNVSEIAFQVGFSSTAYFVKCFREKYGKTPGTVLQA